MLDQHHRAQPMRLVEISHPHEEHVRRALRGRLAGVIDHPAPLACHPPDRVAPIERFGDLLGVGGAQGRQPPRPQPVLVVLLPRRWHALAPRRPAAAAGTRSASVGNARRHSVSGRARDCS